MPFDGFVENTQVTERLVIGRARIEAGWCRGHLTRTRWTLRGRRREYCLMGAVRVDLPGWENGGPDAAADLLYAAITDLGYGRWTQAWEFNDCPGRTKAQVLKVVDLAIAMSQGKRLARKT